MQTSEAELDAVQRVQKGLRDGEAGKGQNQRRQSKQANKSDKEQARIKSPINRQSPKQAGNRSQVQQMNRTPIQRLESKT